MLDMNKTIITLKARRVPNLFSPPRFKNLTLKLTFAALLGSAGIAVAQTSAVNPDSALQLILRGIEGTHLTLNEAVRQGMINSTSVRRAEAAYQSAQGTVRRERGMFDPELFFSLNYEDDNIPTASFFSGADILKNQQTTSQTGLRWTLPVGTRLEASLNTVRLNTNSAFAFLNPQYTAFGSLNLRQPLLGGFSVSARKQLSKAEQDLQAAQGRRDQQALGLSSDVERTYWDLYAAERDYAVRKLTRDQGEAFLSETELRAKAGLIGPSQVANARTFLAEQTILLLDQEEQLDRLSDQLASQIGVRPEPGMQRFVTTDEPPGEFRVDSVEVMVERARQNNLDLQAAKAEIESNRALADAAGWEMLPSVDLVGSLGGNGLAGTPQDVIFNGDTLRTTVGGGFGDAVSQAAGRDFKTWSVGVEVKIPIGFRSGLGEKDRLQAEVSIADQRYIELSRALEEQVRASYRELVHGKERLLAARGGVEAAEEQGRIGLIEFRNGRSTAFELVRLGADFAAAQQRYSAALVRTAKAATTLRQLTSGYYTGTTTK
jgi:outer membrane protein TolC